MSKFFFTFGGNHLDKNGFSLYNSHVVIEAESEGEAREIMHKARGPKYCTSYPENMSYECVLKYNTTERSLEDVTILDGSENTEGE